MPELPEVETFVRALRDPLIGRIITGVRNDWPRHIAILSAEQLRDRIVGRRFLAVDRRGKYLVFTLSDDETLIIHLKMSGHLSVVASDSPANGYDHTIFELDDGRELRFRDIRKFGRVYLVRDPAEVLAPLGPEPLTDTFDASELAAGLAGRQRVLKPLLLDQTFIAGIGNIYADEALFRAGIHPARRSDSLTYEEIAALHAAIREVLAKGIDNRWHPDRLLVVVVEGEVDFLSRATRVSDADESPPVTIGLVGDTWTEELARRIPDNACIAIRTDLDRVGDRYAARVAETLADRCSILRRMS